MTNFSKNLALFLFRARFFLFSIALVVTAIFAWQLPKLKFNLSPEAIFLENDPAYQFYEDTYLKAFKNQSPLSVLAIASDDRNLNLSGVVKEVAKELSKNRYINKVITAFDQPIVLPTEHGFKRFKATDEHGSLTPLAIDYLEKHPLFQGAFLSKKANAMAMILTLVSSEDSAIQNEAIVSINEEVELLKSKHPELKFYLTGLPIIQNEMISLLKTDQMRFVPLVALLLIALLLLMTKHPFGAFFPLLIVFIALIWTVGLLALLGHEINVVNHAIIILIMVIGIADSVHIYTRFVDESIKAHRSKIEEHKKKSRIIIDTLAAMLLPCFLTTATTALGFLSSSVASVEIIKLFGIDTAIGVMFCFFITFMVMPALLSFHKLPRSHTLAFLKVPKALTVDFWLKFVIGKSLRYAYVLTFLSFVIIIVSVYIGKDITANQTWVGELPKDDKVTKALVFIEDNFASVMPFQVVFSGKPEVLRSRKTAVIASEIAKLLRDDPLKPTVRSPSDAIEFLLQAGPQKLSLKDIDDETYHEIVSAMAKENHEQIDTARDFWSADGEHFRIMGFLPNTSTTKAERFREDLEENIKRLSVDNLKIDDTGAALISSHALHNLTKDMASSIGLAILLISIFVGLFFRSLRYTFIAVLPNLVPIAVTIACMDLLGVDVRLATVMIFAMALGLSIDACIHLLCRIREESAKVKNPANKLFAIRSIFLAFHGSGRPIIYTTVILLGGFSIMMFSEFMALRDFAVISSITLISALLADIILLPALLFVTRKRT